MDNSYYMKKALKENLRLYNSIVYSCFKDCVIQLNTENMSPTDEVCVKNCLGKSLSSNTKLVESMNTQTRLRYK